MSISEQANKLREVVSSSNPELYVPKKIRNMILQAADTIESLSAKLQAANMEEENKRIKKNLKYGFCPDCGSAVGRGAGTCFECSAILDWDLLKEDEKQTAKDYGGWITDRVPTKEECNGREREFAVTVDANGIKTLVMDFVYETVRGKEVSRWKWRDRISPWEVIAWHKLPEPYHGS